MSRRDELLAEARKKRLRWVTEAQDESAPMRGEKQLFDTEVARTLPSTRDVFGLVSMLVGELEGDAHFDLPEELLLLEDAPVPEYDGRRSHYAVFLDKLTHPRAGDVVMQLENFVKKFNINNLVGVREQLGGDMDEALDVRVTPVAAAVHSFVRQVCRGLRQHSVWGRESGAVFAETAESVEKFVVTKLYGQLFNPTAMQQEQDRQLLARLQTLSFLTPVHLDLPPALTEADFEAPVQLLRAVEAKRSPRDKVDCIVEMNRAVQEMIQRAKGEEAQPSADDILPVLIYVVKLAAPPQLQSQLQFIQEFRHPDKLLSEAGYVLTCLLSAVHFLQTVRADQLSISRADFEERLRESAQEVEGAGAAAYAAGLVLGGGGGGAAAEGEGYDDALGVDESKDDDDAAIDEVGAAVDPVKPSALRRARERTPYNNLPAPAIGDIISSDGGGGGANPSVQTKKSIRKVLHEARLLLDALEYRGVQPDDVRVVDIAGILGEHRALAHALADLTGKVDTLLATARRSSHRHSTSSSSAMMTPERSPDGVFATPSTL